MTLISQSTVVIAINKKPLLIAKQGLFYAFYKAITRLLRLQPLLWIALPPP